MTWQDPTTVAPTLIRNIKLMVVTHRIDFSWIRIIASYALRPTSYVLYRNTICLHMYNFM